MSPENALYEFIDALVAANPGPGPLSGTAVHATRYEEIAMAKAIRIGDAAVQTGPRLGAWKEFNGEILVEIVARVDGGDRVRAREDVRDLSLAVAEALQTDPTLGSRTDDSIILDGSRGWARVKTAAYAVQILRVVVDPHGYKGG